MIHRSIGKNTSEPNILDIIIINQYGKFIINIPNIKKIGVDICHRKIYISNGVGLSKYVSLRNFIISFLD